MTMKIGCHTYNWMPYARRTGTTLELEQMLSEVAAAGYPAVELSRTPMEVDDPRKTLRLLRKFKLTLVGMSFHFASQPGALEDMKKMARVLADMGGKKMVLFDSVDWEGKTGGKFDGPYRSSVELADGIAEFAAGLGLDAVLHNHLNTNVETPGQIDGIFSRVKRCGLCLDTGHLIAAGGDPAAYARKYAPVIRHVHFKDCLLTPDGRFQEFVELGTGNHAFSLAAVLDELKAARYDGWVVVEQDQTRTTPLESARANREYLRRHGL